MDVAIICEHMHWTYQQFDEQPDWLIAALRIKLREDNHYAQQQSSRLDKGLKGKK